MLAPPPGENTGFTWAMTIVFDLFPKISYHCYQLFENLRIGHLLEVMGRISWQVVHLQSL